MFGFGAMLATPRRRSRGSDGVNVAHKSLLLVDSDDKSLRVLEVSLKKAGFLVTVARTGEEALDRVATANPDLIIADTQVDGMNGFALRERLQSNQHWADVPFIFVTQPKAMQDKIRGLELGVEDYLTKPLYVKEVLTRVKLLLQKREREMLDTLKARQTKFAGTLADMAVVDLIQTVEIGRKSGVIQLSGVRKQRASIYFREGKVIDAELGRLQGAQAIYRLLTWPDGRFEVEFKNVRRRDAIEVSSQGLLMEGMRRLDEWGRLTEQLPSLQTVFEVSYERLAERLAEVPDAVNELLRLFDGRRTLIEVLDDSEADDLQILEETGKLYFQGLLTETSRTVEEAQPESPAVQYDAIQEWLERESSGGGSQRALPARSEPVPGDSGDAEFDPDEFASERGATPSGQLAATTPLVDEWGKADVHAAPEEPANPEAAQAGEEAEAPGPGRGGTRANERLGRGGRGLAAG